MSLERVSSSHETPEEMEIDVGAFDYFVVVSWGALTSSKLLAMRKQVRAP